MQLTRYTDYSLRVLMFLALNQDELINISNIADKFSISQNHLIKVVNHLVNSGYIASKRGRNGGLKLANKPDMITIGEIVRNTEQTLDVINCTEPECPIINACKLKFALDEATEAFLETLDKYTISDLILRNKKLKSILL